LAKKLHILDYDLPAPLLKREISPSRLVLPLKQSAGTACLPKVKNGDRVKTGQIIGEPAANALGAILHAPVDGVIREVDIQQIILEKS
jgi:Na+-translocating ferredoxin:NAD+ oxidoreductase RnfC subunit